MNIQEYEISKVVPYKNNPRINVDAVNVVKKSLKEFGFQQPLVIDKDNKIVVGHTRLLAAKELGLKTVPCVVANDLSDEQIKAYRIMDNKSSEYASWNYGLLTKEVTDLLEADYDLNLTGFDEFELKDLGIDIDLGFAEQPLTSEDDAPAIEENPITVLNDIWQLGNHKLICGDSTELNTLDLLMESQKADLIFTDPPYGISFGGGRAKGTTEKGDKVKAHGMIINDDLRDDDLSNLLKDALSNSKMFAKEEAPCYVCFNYKNFVNFEESFEEAGFKVDSLIVWDKRSIGLGMSNYRPQHEFIFYCKGGQWFGSKNQSDLWSMSRGNTSAYVHPTQKPVELISKALENSSKKGDIVIDVFGGSGSTVIACELHNRKAMIVDLDPKYCDVIIKRWQNYTGKDAIHLETNKTYNELQKDTENGEQKT
jgi:DNA modification methylase